MVEVTQVFLQFVRDETHTATMHALRLEIHRNVATCLELVFKESFS